MNRRFRVGGAWLACLAWLLAAAPLALAQSKSPLPTSPGQDLFNGTCASCHVGPPVAARAPDLKSLMELTPETVLAAMTTGPMMVPAQKLTDAQKRQIAEYLGGRPFDDKHTGDAASMSGHCPANSGPGDLANGASWNGWRASDGNTRFPTAAGAGLSAADVPALKLRWAFGFPNGDTAYGQPS